MIHKEILLLPTQFVLDFWCFSNKAEAVDNFSTKYGLSEYKIGKWITSDQVSIIESTTDSLLKGEKRIVMNVSTMNELVIVHEIVHVIFKLHRLCNIEIGNKSQEWVAYMSEYIYDEILKMK